MGRSPSCRKPEGLKKGPWKPEEDEKLVSYISQHGHGNWQALPKKCGLLRCGKSCRLRWTNYLRPDIKRGGFTAFEEQKIIQLHGLVGNKWAFIASHLPKRTDNEIKNYWNTVLKKRLQKLGLSAETGHSQNSAIGKFNTCINNKHSLNHSANHPTAKNIWQLQQQQSTVLSISTISAAMDHSAGPINQENAANSLNTHISIETAMRSKESRTTSETVSHLAQWEMARLEAEARLSCKQSDPMSHAKSDWISCHSPNPPPLSTPSVNSTALMAALQLSSATEESSGTDVINMIHASGLAMASHEQQVMSMIESSQNDDHAGLDGVVIDGELDQNICNNVLSGDVSSASENMSMNARPAMASQQTDIIGTIINAADGHHHDPVEREAGIINGELVDQSMSDLISDGAINDLQELLFYTASSSAASQILPRHSTSMQSSSNQVLTPGVQQQTDIIGTIINAADGHHDDPIKREAWIINGELVDQSMSDLIMDDTINDLQELLLDKASSSVASQILPRHSTCMQSSSNQVLTPRMQELKDDLQDWLLSNNDVDGLVTVNFSSQVPETLPHLIVESLAITPM